MSPAPRAATPPRLGSMSCRPPTRGLPGAPGTAVGARGARAGAGTLGPSLAGAAPPAAPSGPLPPTAAGRPLLRPEARLHCHNGCPKTPPHRPDSLLPSSPRQGMRRVAQRAGTAPQRGVPCPQTVTPRPDHHRALVKRLRRRRQLVLASTPHQPVGGPAPAPGHTPSRPRVAWPQHVWQREHGLTAASRAAGSRRRTRRRWRPPATWSHPPCAWPHGAAQPPPRPPTMSLTWFPTRGLAHVAV